MAETYLNVRGFGAITIRVDPTMVRGQGSPVRPVLYLPLEQQIRSIKGPQEATEYTVIRMAGVLKMAGGETLAEFDAGPVAQESTLDAHFQQLYVEVGLDFPRIKKFEDARGGSDALLSMGLAGVAWFPKTAKFEKIISSSDLQLKIPRSTWVDQVLPPWRLSNVKLVEINFPQATAGDNFRASYMKVDAAEKLFANGQYKQVLEELYSGFEALAKSMGFAKPNQQFFAGLLAELHPTKKENVKLALDSLCDFLHLGRHEPKEAPGDFNISRSDARFALIMSQSVLEYITPKG